jgi:ADP-ribose pyrophosphatase YjhB (NUDIX family)
LNNRYKQGVLTQKLLTMTNWIQNHVLLELTRNATRRYSELKPRDIEGNLFMYHLKGLIKDGLIEKNEAAYRLTVKGMQMAGHISLQTGKLRTHPKILTAVVCRNEAGEYLFVRWHRQPNIGQVSFPHGMVHFGKSIAAMAAMELAEKAGLEADLTFKGDIYVCGIRADDVDRHMLVHVFVASNIRPGRQDELRPEVSEPFWAQLNTVRREDYVPGFYEVMEIATSTSMPQLSEITIEIPGSESE